MGRYFEQSTAAVIGLLACRWQRNNTQVRPTNAPTFVWWLEASGRRSMIIFEKNIAI